MLSAHEAIDQSILRNEITHIPYSAEAEETLLAECDDSTDAGHALEFWGEDENENTWRVHLDRDENE